MEKRTAWGSCTYRCIMAYVNEGKMSRCRFGHQQHNAPIFSLLLLPYPFFILPLSLTLFAREISKRALVRKGFQHTRDIVLCELASRAAYQTSFSAFGPPNIGPREFCLFLSLFDSFFLSLDPFSLVRILVEKKSWETTNILAVALRVWPNFFKPFRYQRRYESHWEWFLDYRGNSSIVNSNFRHRPRSSKSRIQKTKPWKFVEFLVNSNLWINQNFPVFFFVFLELIDQINENRWLGIFRISLHEAPPSYGDWCDE